MATGKPEHFANDELTGHCILHDEDFEGDRCLKCHSLKALQKREVLKPAKQGKITRAIAKKAVRKVSKLRARKHQLGEICDKIRKIIYEEVHEVESITCAEVVGVLDMLKMEVHQDWWLKDSISDELNIP